MLKTVHAPFTKSQFESLVDFQKSGKYHPYRALHMNPKDSCMDQKRQRKVRKEEFTHALDMEVE
jgi:hypothetical protein